MLKPNATAASTHSATSLCNHVNDDDDDSDIFGQLVLVLSSDKALTLLIPYDIDVICEPSCIVTGWCTEASTQGAATNGNDFFLHHYH